MPHTDVRFVGKELAPVREEGGSLLLGVTHTIDETPAPDLVLVPGGGTTPGQMVDDDVLEWLRKVHQTTAWTTSVCTGALILGAAGIDLALWLAAEIHGRAWAEAIQLMIEYDPHPPVDSGHMRKASPETRKLAKELMDRSIPADQRRIVPRIAWRQFIDLLRTGK
ncbi:MAG TPA: DJ-1/PfpI family protein [Bryobacteraceae bacterium]|nr:DJ-1/PfpI family protein [Bryobacteraceae bacterium]